MLRGSWCRCWPTRLSAASPPHFRVVTSDPCQGERGTLCTCDWRQRSPPDYWNFDKKIWSCRSVMELFGCSAGAFGIIGQQWRYLQRYPAINAVRRVVHRAKEISSLGKVLQCQFKEECFTSLPLSYFLADGIVVVLAVLHSVVEDRRI